MNNAKLGVVAVNIYVKPVGKKLKNPISVLVGSILDPLNLDVLERFGPPYWELRVQLSDRPNF